MANFCLHGAGGRVGGFGVAGELGQKSQSNKLCHLSKKREHMVLAVSFVPSLRRLIFLCIWKCHIYFCDPTTYTIDLSEWLLINV